MILWDVIARVDNDNVVRAVAKIPNGDPLPESAALFQYWIRLKRAVSGEEADYELNQYPYATRAKC